MTAASGSLPAPEAVQVLVSSLADESSIVRDASFSALKEIAPLNPLLVLDCCCSVYRGVRLRLVNMTGVFSVMACAVRAVDEREVDTAQMTKLAKIATAEIITSKDLNAEWQRAAASLLVSIGSHAPDLMMEEIFFHLSGPNSALPAMVQILADFASAEAVKFTPHLKDVLLRVLPILGSVKDIHRPIFANAFKRWCEATWQYIGDFPSHTLLDNDVISFLNSVFELLLRVWASSWDLKVRLSSVEALGEMAGLVSRTQLKAVLPRLVSTILDLYNKDQEMAFLASCSLHNVLNACLLSENGPPLLDFEDLNSISCTLLPVAFINNENDDYPGFSKGLKTYNEILHCFLVIGSVYPEDLYDFLLSKCRANDVHLVVGVLCVIKHLLPRFLDAWHAKMNSLIEVVKSLLIEQSLNVRKALAELLIVMASHCYFGGASAEFVEYLVYQCALLDDYEKYLKPFKEFVWKGNVFQPFYRKIEISTSAATPAKLRAICEKGLLLLAITVPEMEQILWPFLLKLIIPKKYTGAVAIVCKCISELYRQRLCHGSVLFNEVISSNGIPAPVDLLARLTVLLHDPLARNELPTQILTVLCYLVPLFPKNLSLFWQDEVPKLKAYINDPEDLKQDLSFQDTWDDMIINFISESLDVAQDTEWVISLGNAFARQYVLYVGDDDHAAMLHRCLGILLQKVDDRLFVHEKIEWMYSHANTSVPANRLGLAKGIGLVAASHLDTVLEKLKNILDNVVQNRFQRLFSFFSKGGMDADADDIHATLALMYGYAARYAPSSAIEARIDALVGTNMLSRLLHVQHPTAKQAVITAIELLGCAVINAAEMGICFPLKRRDQLLDYVLTLMGTEASDDFSDSSNELLNTQSLALSACTTLVSIEPRLPLDTRNLVLKATLGLFTLPNEPTNIIDPLITNLITLLCAILQTSGEDGRSRAEQLLHILRQIDLYVLSSVEHQRRRGCFAVHEMLLKFRSLCSGGICGLGCHSNCTHNMQIGTPRKRNFATLPSAYLLPSRDSLCLGERVITYLSRCADVSSEVRKVAIQIIGLFFSISLSLPRSAVPGNEVDLESSYSALTSLEDVISMLRRDESIDQSEVFNRVVFSVCILLTKDELVIALHMCTTAICDKIKQSADGAILAVIEFITTRGSELNEADISRTTQSLLLAASSVTDKHSRQEILQGASCLAECTASDVVFNEVLVASARDIMTKDVSRLRGGWPLHDAFYAFSQHGVLSSLFLEYIISVLDRFPAPKIDKEKGESSSHSSDSPADGDLLQAAVLALTAFFRGGGKTGKKVVEQNYSSVLSALTLQLGSCHGLAGLGQLEHLRVLLAAFHAFCDCVGDLEMGKILSRHGENIGTDKWIDIIRDISSCISLKRPKEVPHICIILNKALKRYQRFQREAASAALSEYIRHSDGAPSLLEEIVEGLCLHVSDESPVVRSLCLRGLVQIPKCQMPRYVPQVLGVIIALLEDHDESVQLTAVQCLLTVLKLSPQDAVDPILISLFIRLRNLQVAMNAKLRANAFAAYGALCEYDTSTQHHAFLEQVHATLPRLILHLHDDELSVRQACRNTFKKLAPLMGVEGLSSLFSKQHFNSDCRSDYEDFMRDLTRQLAQFLAPKVDTYLASLIQAFDAPWPIIQANAIYFSSCILTLLEDQRTLAHYQVQVLALLVGKLSQYPDAIVRSTCSLSLGLLLKTSYLHMLTAPTNLDRDESLTSLQGLGL
ncbi:hypothetical protein KSP39_PZI012653 [Platanthera zijinensis]|uniref:Uncharacterized protein n=1 Tax=Platanthera zijinensis TaxID=2320716 RepID=A0AAP0BFI5_9ASPA